MRPLFSFPADHSLATALPAATIPYNSPPYGNRPRSDRLIWARDESPMNYGGECRARSVRRHPRTAVRRASHTRRTSHARRGAP